MNPERDERENTHGKKLNTRKRKEIKNNKKINNDETAKDKRKGMIVKRRK